MDVSFRNVTVERGGRRVLDVADLRLKAGRTTAILGPNGSGKTTLLRLIAALEPPRTGEIQLSGVAVRADAATRYRIAYVFQEQVFLRQSVRDNLELGLRLRGIDAAERHVRLERAAALLGIGHLFTGAPTHCRVVKRVARAWRARCACTRRWFCSTSRLPASTARPTFGFSTSCRGCWRRSHRPRCSSLTIVTRPFGWPTIS
jgi:ABC-type Fe3+/spermidine/putrescine transport system ATPase subunit